MQLGDQSSQKIKDTIYASCIRRPSAIYSKMNLLTFSHIHHVEEDEALEVQPAVPLRRLSKAPRTLSMLVAVKTLLRILISLLIVLWLGAVMFFPAVAGVAFHTLPDHATAGLFVRNCLSLLHSAGLVEGSVLLVLLLLAAVTRAYGRTLVGPLLCTVAMLLLTAFSQHGILPRMQADRLAVGGDTEKAAFNDPHRLEFNRLHSVSEELEEGVLVAGLAMVVFLARPQKLD